MYKLILVTYLVANGNANITQQVIGEFATKDSCRAAAGDADQIPREPAVKIGWTFICVAWKNL